MLHSVHVDPLGLLVCLPMASCGKIISKVSYFAYGVEKLGSEVHSVVRKNVLGSAVRVDSVLLDRS